MRISKYLISDIEEIKDRSERIYAAAMMYAEAGFYVIPIQINSKAIPPKKYGISYPHASRRKQVMERWFGKEGRFRGWNIGLATGRQGGIFVVDLDKKVDKDGFEDFEKIKPPGYLYEGPVQTTPSLGAHMIFHWSENGRSTTETLGPGIDTRGGTADKCKGHIVVWPSTINGAEYRWSVDGEVPEMPEWLVLKMGSGFKGVSGGAAGRGNEEVSDRDYEDKFSVEKLQEMLEIINPDDLSYDQWREIGQAIHSQHPTTEGFELWDSWSQNGERYEQNECLKRWHGFNSSGAIRVGTLIAYAKQRGYDLRQLSEARMEHDEKLEVIIEDMNKKYAVCPMGSDIMVVEKCDVVPEMRSIQPRYRFWKKVGFRNYFENQVTMAVDSEGKPRMLSYADIWLAHPERCTYPSGVGLFPNKPERYHGYFNLWQGFAHKPKSGSWDRFDRHIHDIICAGDEELYEWVLDWLADLIQDPGNPKGCAIVLHGIEGCGKGTFCQIIGQIFGSHYKHLTDQEHLVGRFNGHMADAIFVFADEAVFGGDRKVAGKLKSLVTEPVITSERKGVDAVQFRNCTHLVVASNESWFIPAGPQSRRWLVLDVLPNKANDQEYFGLIHKEMEKEEGIEAMMYDLMYRDITRNLRQAPETTALQVQREQYASMDSAIEWWINQLSMGVLSVEAAEAEINGEDQNKPWPNRVLKNDMLDNYTNWCKDNKRRKVSPARFYNTMISAGLEPCRLKTPGGNRPYGYRVPSHSSCEQIAKEQFGFVPLTLED